MKNTVCPRVLPVEHWPSLVATTLAHYKHMPVQMHTICGGSDIEAVWNSGTGN